MEIKPQLDDREFSGDFSGTSTEEIRKIVKQGINNHIFTSKTSAAKRELDDRNQQELLAGNKRIESTIKEIDKKNEFRSKWSFYLLIASTILSAIAVILALAKR